MFSVICTLVFFFNHGNKTEAWNLIKIWQSFWDDDDCSAILPIQSSVLRLLYSLIHFQCF